MICAINSQGRKGSVTACKHLVLPDVVTIPYPWKINKHASHLTTLEGRQLKKYARVKAHKTPCSVPMAVCSLYTAEQKVQLSCV